MALEDKKMVTLAWEDKMIMACEDKMIMAWESTCSLVYPSSVVWSGWTTRPGLDKSTEEGVVDFSSGAPPPLPDTVVGGGCFILYTRCLPSANLFVDNLNLTFLDLFSEAGKCSLSGPLVFGPTAKSASLNSCR